MKPSLCFLALTVSLLSGCASKLTIYDAGGNPLKGVPVRTPILVEVTTETTYEIDPKISTSDPRYETIKELCAPTTKSTTSFLPLGTLSYVNFEPALFGKSEFKVEFSDSGLLKTLALNSDPAATTEAVSKLLGTVLPYVATPKPIAKLLEDEPDLEKTRAAVCIVKDTKIKTIKERKVEQQ